MRVEQTGAALAVTGTDDERAALQSLAAKVSGGDLLGECALLMRETGRLQFRQQVQGVEGKQHALRELRVRLKQLADEQAAAQRRAGNLGLLGKVLGGILTAVGAIATFVYPPVGAIITVGGVLLAGGLSIGSAEVNRQATGKEADRLRAEQQRQEMAEAEQDCLSDLEAGMALESRLGQHLLAFVEAEGARLDRTRC